MRLHEADGPTDHQLAELWRNVLDSVMHVTLADFGWVLIEDESTKRLGIVAELGQPRPRREWGSSQEEAALSLPAGSRIIVEDVSASFDGSQLERCALLEAGLHAFVCGPIVAPNGERLGVISTFSRAAGRPTDRQLQLVDRLVHHAVELIEQRRVTRALEAHCAREQEARARADVTNHRMGQFLATLLHELRQPLSAALPALEVQKRSTSVERQARAAELIEQQLRQIARLVEDLADVSQISLGRVELRRERIDLRTVVHEALGMTQSLFEWKQHFTAIALGPEPSWVMADPVRMKQVFSNLLRNAAIYSRPCGKIRLSISTTEGRVVARLQDNGIGIPADSLERIFEVFERGTDEQDSSSLGIGLAVVRQIVELHGGTVTVTSEGVGKGSEFVVTLPEDVSSPS